MSEELEEARILALRNKLIHELMNKLALSCGDFLDRPEVNALPQDIQISCVYSAFLSLWVHYKFHLLTAIPFDQEKVNEAIEITKLEELFKKGDNGEQDIQKTS